MQRAVSSMLGEVVSSQNTLGRTCWRQLQSGWASENRMSFFLEICTTSMARSLIAKVTFSSSNGSCFLYFRCKGADRAALRSGSIDTTPHTRLVLVNNGSGTNSINHHHVNKHCHL